VYNIIINKYDKKKLMVKIIFFFFKKKKRTNFSYFIYSIISKVKRLLENPFTILFFNYKLKKNFFNLKNNLTYQNINFIGHISRNINHISIF